MLAFIIGICCAMMFFVFSAIYYFISIYYFIRWSNLSQRLKYKWGKTNLGFINDLDLYLTNENFDGNLIIEHEGKLYHWTVGHNLEPMPFDAVEAYLSGDGFIYSEGKNE